MGLGAATLTTLQRKTTHTLPAAPKAHELPPKPRECKLSGWGELGKK